MKIGTNDISKIYLGGSEVTSIYLGTSQVYSGGSEPTPPISWVSYNENQEVPTGDTIYGIRVNTNAVSPTGGESMDFSDGRSIIYSFTSHKWQYIDTNFSSHDLTIDQDGYVSMEFDNGATITWSSVNTNNSAPYYFPFDCDLNYQAPSFDTQYLTFDILSGGTINWVAKGSQPRTISYSLDGGSSWSSITSSTVATSFNVNAGDKVLWKGTNTNLASNTSNYSSFSGSTASFNIKGNIMSLIYGDDFEGEVNLSGKTCCFAKLFYNTTNLINAENLILPATTLSISCYLGMFNGCTSLTTAPELPATTLAISCYNNMFYGCTSLTTAPELPATTLATSCYNNMFYGCTSLTTAPVLPATTLASSCYQSMFNGCTSLTTAPQLSATTLVSGCYYSMFQGCTSLNSITCLATDISASDCTKSWVVNVASSGTFTKAANMCDWTTGIVFNGIPNNWTVTPDDCGGSAYHDE